MMDSGILLQLESAKDAGDVAGYYMNSAWITRSSILTDQAEGSESNCAVPGTVKSYQDLVSVGVNDALVQVGGKASMDAFNIWGVPGGRIDWGDKPLKAACQKFKECVDLMIRFFRSSVTPLVFSVTFLIGCEMPDSTIQEIIQEMDDAYAKDESNEDVTKVVGNYFVLGDDFDDVLPLLSKFNSEDFKIHEVRYGVSRVWPDGEFQPPPDELVKLSLERQYPKGTKGFVIKKI